VSRALDRALDAVADGAEPAADLLVASSDPRERAILGQLALIGRLSEPA
jgi:hypothetical protein